MAPEDRVNILLVDDQPAKLLSYEVILGELGENLIRANCARDALELLLKNEVAVILVDVCMPELDGFDLAKMLRTHPRYEKTAIIFVSAVHLSDLDLVRGYETGAVDYVPVPVIPEVLRAKVRIFAELWRKTRQLERLNRELERRVTERTLELEKSTAEVRDGAERLRLASEAAGVGTYDYNASAGQLYWSPYLRLLVGLESNGPLTLDQVLTVVHSDHHEVVRHHVLGREAAGPQELEFKIVKPDGEVRWLLDRGQAVPNPDSGLRVMGTILDITERKRAEERQRLLMAELDHRVKNILSNVSAVARLSSHRADSVDSFVVSLDGRIQAISRAHGLLRRGAWEGANLAELAQDSLDPFLAGGEKNIEISGEGLSIVPELAQSMALILHELATNAVKHGALSTPNGRVKVSWSRLPPGALRFEWVETGGPRPVRPVAKGFGLNVLESAAADLDAVAKYGFGEEGFVYSLEGRFELYKGRNEREQAARPPPPIAVRASPPSAPACRILVVEDEALVALQLQGDLEDDGHEVIGPARSVKHGLLLASEEKIDAAFVDVSLGRETSAPIAERLLARNIPFAFATGYSDASILPEHLRGIPKLSKPYVIGEIRRMLAGLIAQAAVGQKPSPP